MLVVDGCSQRHISRNLSKDLYHHHKKRQVPASFKEKKNNEISHMKLSNYLPHTSFFHWLADVVAGRRKPIRGKI